MKKSLGAFIILGGILLGFSSCMEIHPLYRPKDPPISTNPTCVPPSFEKNIVGKWHFETFNPENKIRTGTITFDAQKNIIDPDSLFTNRIDIGGRVIVKTYDPTIVNPLNSLGPLFLVKYIAVKGIEGHYYRVTNNECNKIRMVFIGSEKSGFELTR